MVNEIKNVLNNSVKNVINQREGDGGHHNIMVGLKRMGMRMKRERVLEDRTLIGQKLADNQVC